MGTKSSTNATHGGVIEWLMPHLIPVPEVHELYGEEAERQWNAACLNQYLDANDRAFAPTAPTPLL